MTHQSKYMLLEEAIIRDIESNRYQPNDQIPSENTFCAQFNTSRTTVRKAIDELVLRNWLYRVQGVGTFVKKIPSNAACTEKVILVQPNYEELYSAGIVSDMIRGIEMILNKENFSFVTIMEPRSISDIDSFLAHLQSEQPSGIIYSFCYGNGIMPRLQQLDIPIVFLDAEPEDNVFDLVTGEDFDSAYKAVCLAHSEGIRNIGFYSVWDKGFSTMRLRSAGVSQAIRDLNLPHDPKWIRIQECNTLDFHSDVVLHDKVTDLKDFIRECPELEMLIVGNDDAAFSLYKACSELNLRIPEDIKVISYGNYNWNSFFNIGFSSFEQNFFQYGKEAAALLVKRIRGQLPPLQQKRTISYKLIRRKSF